MLLCVSFSSEWNCKNFKLFKLHFFKTKHEIKAKIKSFCTDETFTSRAAEQELEPKLQKLLGLGAGASDIKNTGLENTCSFSYFEPTIVFSELCVYRLY